MTRLPTTIVIATVGRPSLQTLLDALAAGEGPAPADVVLVDDRRAGADLADILRLPPALPVRVIRSGGGGPARARNLGWRSARTPWVSFLDDDVVPDTDWRARLAADLDAADSAVAGSCGRVRVPLPTDRAPTDWERGTAGLATARWITADLTYRRSALAAVGGFDERFPRAFREDSDLGLRVSERCGRLVRGQRWITHPVRPADDWVSLRAQAGNADDALMRRLHGRDWRARVGAPTGRRSRHVTVVAAAAAAAAAALAGRRGAALAGAALWLVGTAEFALARIAPGPRDAAEVRRMVLTSIAIPFAATWHAAAGAWRHLGAKPWRGVPDLALFDRDGTLVADVPYNADPARVAPVPGARAALDALRGAGVRVGVVTNQSGIARGLLTPEQVEAVNGRVEDLLGPFHVVLSCPHGPDDGCGCRKPAPGMVKEACRIVGVEPARCVVVGDVESDIEAAVAAGARGILVPTAATRRHEIAGASRTAPDLASAAATILAGAW